MGPLVDSSCHKKKVSKIALFQTLVSKVKVKLRLRYNTAWSSSTCCCTVVLKGALCHCSGF